MKNSTTKEELIIREPVN